MPTSLLLPSRFRLVKEVPDGSDRHCWLKTVAASARCPNCQHRSSRVHSRYQRTLDDSPSSGQPVRLHIQVRRFFCDFKGCSQKTFAEPIADLAARYARRTQRLQRAQTCLSQSVGSRPGVRLGRALAMPTSATTLLRLEREAPLPDRPTPRLLGVDDWAFKKGQRYGTILIDLERHWVVDLLPDRSAESLAEWLKAHPGVEVVSRDRGGCYAEGVRQGAENAVQVADRWHLLKNIGDTLERLLIREHAPLREAARQVALPSAEIEKERETNSPPAPTRPLSQSQQERSHRRQRRLTRYEQLVTLKQQGLSLREIARRLQLSRNTVRKWVAAGCFREQPPRCGGSRLLAPFVSYLQKRWEEGCQNATVLFQEIVAKGFCGSVNVVQRHVQSWRQYKQTSRKSPREAPPSTRCVRWWLLGHYSQDAPKQRARQIALVERLCQICPVVHMAQDLAQRFIAMVKQRRASDLDAWLEEVTRSQIAEMVAFAQGLEQDRDAVMAALSSEVSNGHTEGQVNRLKMKKRQMYGRANFDLLRRRVLQPT